VWPAPHTSPSSSQQSPPPTSHHASTPTPTTTRRLSQRFGELLPSDPHVPSTPFHTTSTAYSTRCSRACCISLPDMGLTVFRRPPQPALPHRNGPTPAADDLLLTASHPSKNSPRSQPHRVTAACCPLAVGMLRFTPQIRLLPDVHAMLLTTPLTFRALLPERVRNAVGSLRNQQRPILPWAFHFLSSLSPPPRRSVNRDHASGARLPNQPPRKRGAHPTGHTLHPVSESPAPPHLSHL